MKRMASRVKQAIDNLAFFVEYRWSLSQADTVDWTYLETFSTLVTTIDALQESIDYPLHWRQKTLFLQTVVESTRADTRPCNMRADSVQGHAFFRQVFSIRSDESHHAAIRSQPDDSSNLLLQYNLLFRCGIHRECYDMVSESSCDLRPFTLTRNAVESAD